MPMDQPWKIWGNGSHETSKAFYISKLISNSTTQNYVYIVRDILNLSVWQKHFYFNSVYAVPPETHGGVYLAEKCTDRSSIQCLQRTLWQPVVLMICLCKCCMSASFYTFLWQSFVADTSNICIYNSYFLGKPSIISREKTEHHWQS